MVQVLLVTCTKNVRFWYTSSPLLKRAVLSASRSTKTRTKVKVSIPHPFDGFWYSQSRTFLPYIPNSPGCFHAPALLLQDIAYSYRVWITLIKLLYAPLRCLKIDPEDQEWCNRSPTENPREEPGSNSPGSLHAL